MPGNPYKQLYFNPSIPVVNFAKKTQKFHNWKELNMLKRAAGMVGYIVVESSVLNWRQRKKYCENRFKIGYEVYYFLAEGIASKIKKHEP